MSTDTSSVTPQKTIIEFKSSTFVVPALLIHSADLAELNDSICQKIQQTPEFFKESPVLIDITPLAQKHANLNLTNLLKLIRASTLIPIALKGGNAEQNKQAISAGLCIQTVHTTFDADRSAAVAETNNVVADTATNHAAEPSQPAEEDFGARSLMVTTPVRSGQRIYSEGDLTITAHVSAGAEIMAEGSIHVYGSLRGRALAGVKGDTNCRIFCNDCQAELISIAGNYKVTDNLDPATKNKPVQIYLQDHALIIEAL